VWSASGRFINERIVENGDAKTLAPPKKNTKNGEELPLVEGFYVGRLGKAQVRAEMAQRGLWGACPATGD
jgi:endonuclease YncB( thermonuclease family)